MKRSLLFLCVHVLVFGLVTTSLPVARVQAGPIGAATLDDAFSFAQDRFNLAISGSSIADGALTTTEYLVSTRTTVGATQGKWDTGSSGGWISGFWPGCLWQTYEALRTYEAVALPEPSTLLMLALCVAAAVLLRRQLLGR